MIALATSGNDESNSQFSKEPRWPGLRRNLALSTTEASAYGAMVGLGETYLPAFALAMGMGEVTAGLVASVPLLVGGVLQTISPKAIQWIGSYRRWIILTAAIQCASLVPLVLSALRGSISPLGLFLIASVYWFGGLAVGPAWNTWIGYIVPSSIRSRFFAYRIRWAQLLTFSGFIVGGVLLQTSSTEHLLSAFAAIFAIACGCRLFSTILLAYHREPSSFQATITASQASVSGTPIIAEKGRRLIAYLVAVQGMVQFSGPYFTPYMLKHLGLSYGQFVGLIAACFIAKAAALPLWGRMASQHGARWLLWLGGTTIVPLSALWVVSDYYPWLIAVQVISGVTWAAYELGFFLMFFESMPSAQRAKILTMYNLANTSAWCGGALLGGWLLYGLGPTQSSYHLLFILSGFGRLVSLALLARVECPSLVTAALAKLRSATLPARNMLNLSVPSFRNTQRVTNSQISLPGLDLSCTGESMAVVAEVGTNAALLAPSQSTEQSAA